MKRAQMVSLIGITGWVAVWPVAGREKFAKELPGTQTDIQWRRTTAVQTRTAPSVEPQSTPAGKEPWVGVKVAISDDERRVIQQYAARSPAPEVSGKKNKPLPPGLAKKAARGRELPPGWQSKCVRGQIMSLELFEHCRPLPSELVVKLPPPPPGTITVTLEGKLVRLVKATREILDVFDVHLRL